jgi:hypothetical protein
MRLSSATDRLLSLLIVIPFCRVLEEVRELWTETVPGSGGRSKPVQKERIVSKMFLRGDSVILVVSAESVAKAAAQV